MTKAKENPTHQKEMKDKEPKGKSNLFGRVKKVVKKSRRRLGEEKFEKELQRTIEFLAELQGKLNNHSEGGVAADATQPTEKKSVKTEKKPVKKVEKRAEKRSVRNEAKKARPGKKGAKKQAAKQAAKGAGKKGNGTGHKGAPAVPAHEPVLTQPSDTQPTDERSIGQ
jgi:hypothetical protein